MEILNTYGTIPLNSSTLQDLVAEESRALYQSSYNDRISRMEQSGLLIRLRRGLYVANTQNISRELIANHLLGPSYISLESALSHHQLIPERVNTMQSVCLQRARTYDTPLGRFEYTRIPADYYSIGMEQVISNDYAYLIATPEKALCDLITTTAQLRFQSVKAVREYLIDDLRIDTDEHPDWDISIITACIETGRKKRELRFLREALNTIG